MPIMLMLLALMPLVLQAEAGRDALRLGRTSDQALYDAFNAGYQLAPAGPVASAEIITEFRRAVLIVRDHANQGEYGFTERDLVTIVVEIRLNPLNTFINAPPYTLYIRTGPSTKPLLPRNFERTALFGVPMARPGSPLTGVRLSAAFSVADIESAAAPSAMVLDDKGDVLWSARLDLSRFR
jgi:hypothetical protein